MNSSKALASLLASAAILGLLAAALGWNEHPAASTPSAATSPTVADQQFRVPASPISVTAQAGSQHSPLAPLEPSWTDGLGNAQAYAMALRLREARRPGSFAASLTLTQTCQSAWGVANMEKILGPGRDPLAGDAVNRPNYAKRLQARDLINQRCQAFVQHQGLRDPLADDEDGKLIAMILRPWFAFLPDLRVQREVASELARQGHLHLYPGILKHWNGRSYASEAPLYESALQLAQLLATAPPGGAAQDVRVLEACLRVGFCADSYSDYWFNFREDGQDPVKRAKLENMAHEMATAMRAGDYSKFLPQ